MKKPTIIIEQYDGMPGADMRMKVEGPTIDLIRLLHGAMTVDPDFKRMVEVALQTLPLFQQCTGTSIVKDFSATKQQ